MPEFYLGNTLLIIASIVAVAATLVLAALVCTAASRPVLSGELRATGLKAQVVIDRDEDGIPSIVSQNRSDAALALGFLHAQERFFQMDMIRRSAAGELAEVLGASLISADRKARVHQFRIRAEKTYLSLSDEERAYLQSYTDGVNAGLGALRMRSWEYLLLRSQPEPWRPQDSLLVVFFLYRSLQDERADQDYHRYLLYRALPRKMADFLAPEGTAEWDAPLAGEVNPPGDIPGPEVFDLRTASLARMPHFRLRESRIGGSNAWAVSARDSGTGHAIVANDMHLPFQMPTIFYRALMRMEERQLNGVTVPGFPFLLAGSNGDVAWGLTNAAIDAVDLVRLDQAGLTERAYRTASGIREVEFEREVIRVRGARDVEISIGKTVWGPIVRKTRDGVIFAHSWLAYLPSAVNLAWDGLESATSVSEAVAAAHRIGTPALAVVIADRQGEVGWTLAGALPAGALDSRRLPLLSSWRQWPETATETAPHPSMMSPQFGRIWAANCRAVTTGSVGDLLSGGPHVCGARGRQIRDRLLALKVADGPAMLDLQRDTRAHFLDRWGQLMLALLSSSESGDERKLQRLREVLETWDGCATSDSVAYPLIRRFREIVERLVFEPFCAAVQAKTEPFDLSSVSDQLEQPLWQLVNERPPHLLAPWFKGWDDLLQTSLNAVLSSAGEPLSWGRVNELKMRHMLSAAVGRFFGRFIDAPGSPLDGDLHMPLAQTPAHGPVFRFVVSPGAEHEGTATMSGGQAGHFMSPYYLAGHDAWLAGRAAPFCPGATRFQLLLRPEEK